LNEPPFGLTPNGKFFFDGSARGEVLDALQHAVLDDDGIIMVVGEVGSGKTMLCRMLAERLPRDRVELVYLANPSFGPAEILHSLLADWGLPVPADRPALLAIQDALMERHAQGRRVAVLIDEAQAMSPESLEEIKLLSNLETEQHKLLQIVLFGQPELDALLALPKLRQVRDRVVHRFDLSPLTVEDACAYVNHRLRRAGWQGGNLFDPKALRQLAVASGGRARAIHLLADKALLAAFADGARQVSKQHVRRAIADFKGTAPRTREHRDLRKVLLTLSLLGGVLMVGIGLGHYLGQRNAQPSTLAAPSPATQPVAPAVSPIAAVVSEKPADASPVPQTQAHPAQAVPKAARPPAAPVNAPEPPVPQTAAERPMPLAPNATLAERYESLPPSVRDIVLRTRHVFDNPSEQGWTLQIGTAADVPSLVRLLTTLKTDVPVWVQDRHYPNQSSPCWAVYLGRYASREAAVQALSLMANTPTRAGRPLIRTLQGIRTEPYPERAPS
jgi:type II secretory pathway predicted ATPase ExeA